MKNAENPTDTIRSCVDWLTYIWFRTAYSSLNEVDCYLSKWGMSAVTHAMERTTVQLGESLQRETHVVLNDSPDEAQRILLYPYLSNPRVFLHIAPTLEACVNRNLSGSGRKIQQLWYDGRVISFTLISEPSGQDPTAIIETN